MRWNLHTAIRARAFATLAILAALTACGRSDSQPADPAQAATSIDAAPMQDPADPAGDTLPAAPAGAGSPGVEIDVGDLIDPAHTEARAGEAGWDHVRRGSADLDGDGEEEALVVTARARVTDGMPEWDDGQPWQVYVEEEDGGRTHLFAGLVQLGTVSARIALPQSGSATPTIVVLRHVPDQISMFEARYRGPGDVEVRRILQRDLEPVGDLYSPMLP